MSRVELAQRVPGVGLRQGVQSAAQHIVPDWLAAQPVMVSVYRSMREEPALPAIQDSWPNPPLPSLKKRLIPTYGSRYRNTAEACPPGTRDARLRR